MGFIFQFNGVAEGWGGGGRNQQIKRLTSELGVWPEPRLLCYLSPGWAPASGTAQEHTFGSPAEVPSRVHRAAPLEAWNGREARCWGAGGQGPAAATSRTRSFTDTSSRGSRRALQGPGCLHTSNHNSQPPCLGPRRETGNTRNKNYT